MKLISIYLFSTAFLLLTAIGYNKVESNTSLDFSNQIGTEIQGLDNPGPDLIATNFRSSLPFGNAPCPGAAQADGTCNGGVAPSLRMVVTITNQGNIGILPNIPIKIQWRVGPVPAMVQTVMPPAGLPAGASINVVSPTFTMPCPAGPPFALNTGFLGAFVDFGNCIVECDESNNASNTIPVCHN